MTAGQRASQLWELLTKAKAAEDTISREAVLTALDCTDEELHEATEILRQMIDNATHRIQADRSPSAHWVPLAKRTPSKEIRRLIAHG